MAIFWTAFRARWARPTGWTAAWRRRPGDALPVIAVSIHVDYNQLLRRITGRRNCPVCQTIYNVYVNPPKRDGFCDVEGAALVQRADDTEEVFKERMRAYEALTAPVIEHYRALGRFAEVDGDRPIHWSRPELLLPSSGCGGSAAERRACVVGGLGHVSALVPEY